MSAEEEFPLPPANVWRHVCKQSITHDKPIMLDYWVSSLKKNVFLGIRANDEKLLVKSAEEYTSPITSMAKLDDVYIICTENSIYIVSAHIDKRKIS
jgi:hypothetical protein